MNSYPPKEYNGIAETYRDSWKNLKDLPKTKKVWKAGKILLNDEAKFIKYSESPMIFQKYMKLYNKNIILGWIFKVFYNLFYYIF